MTEERNREILRRRRAGETFPALARDYQISRERVRQIVEREDRREQRQTELAKADSRPDQPNPLHLERHERRILAEFCGKADFTPDDVQERGFWRGNFRVSAKGVIFRFKLAPRKLPYVQALVGNGNWADKRESAFGKGT